MRRRNSGGSVELPAVKPETAAEVQSWIDWQVRCSQDPEMWREWQARYATPDEHWNPYNGGI